MAEGFGWSDVYDRADDTQDGHFIEKEIVGYLAGLVAESEYYEPGTPPMVGWFPWEVHTEDYRRAGTLTRNLYEPYGERQQFLGRMIDRTYEILDSNWSAVEALAQALLERGKLSGAKACRIIAANMPKKQRRRQGRSAP